jgi:hypothetical protein
MRGDETMATNEVIHGSTTDDRFRRVAAVAAIMSAPLALASLFAAMPAVDWNWNTVTDLMLFLRTGARGADAGRWSMLFDMFGYYLLIAPATFVVGRSLERRSPLSGTFFSGCVLAYVLIGAAGAAILAAVLPPLMKAYPSASGGDRTMIETVYRAMTDAVYGGLWNILEETVAGVGWFGLGLLLRGKGRRKLGALTIALGVSCLVDGLGNTLGIGAVADPGLYGYLLLAPAWAVWIGIDLLRSGSAPHAG